MHAPTAMATDLARYFGTGKTFFDSLELGGMYLFARLLHGFQPGTPGVPEQGPVIVVANHPSHADPLFLIAACRRTLHFLQAKECYEVPLLRRIFARAGCIPVARDSADRHALRVALKRLQAGEAVALFPEGEVYPDGCAKARNGAAWLALHSGARVVPARILHAPRERGSVATWFYPSSGTRVVFGEPIDLRARFGEGRSRQNLQEATTLLMERITALGDSQPAAAALSTAPLPASGPALGGVVR